MAKIQVFRKSGNIVDPVAAAAYREAWGPIYDRIVARIDAIHSNTSNRLFKFPKHVLSWRFCNFIERQLYRKFATVVEVEVPRSAKGWNSLIERYDNNPIMLAQRADGKGVVAVIIDTAMD